MYLVVCDSVDVANCSISTATFVDPAYIAAIPLDFTPEAVASVFAFGFGAVLSMWALGFVVGAVIAVIRKL